MTPLEARALAKTMFRELAKIPPRLPSGHDNPEFFERAAVLADVVLQSSRPDVGEALALAVRGRVTPYSWRFANMDIGVPVPPDTEGAELANAITRAGDVLFPPRRSPCMPNRADLRRLVIDAYGEGPGARALLHDLWREMEETCASGRAMDTLRTANHAIGGHGVESMVYRTPETRTAEGNDMVVFDYVNMGDTYAETVGFIYSPEQRRRTHRFLVTTVGVVVEQTERRFRDRGEWRQW